MRGPFSRACPEHKCDIIAKYSESGHESLWCKKGGERISTWIVVDADGETLAVAFLNESPQMVSAEMDLPDPKPPDRVCRHGHFEWVLDTDGKWRCRTCRRAWALKHRPAPGPKKPTAHKRKSAKERAREALEILGRVDKKQEEKKACRRARRSSRQMLLPFP